MQSRPVVYDNPNTVVTQTFALIHKPTGKTIKTHTLILSPQTFKITDIGRTDIEPTLGGFYRRDYGYMYSNVQIQGHFGFKGREVNGRLISGESAFKDLRDLVRDVFGFTQSDDPTKRKIRLFGGSDNGSIDPEYPANELELRWYNWQDPISLEDSEFDYYILAPQNNVIFDYQRTAQRPMIFEYNWPFIAIRKQIGKDDEKTRYDEFRKEALDYSRIHPEIRDFLINEANWSWIDFAFLYAGNAYFDFLGYLDTARGLMLDLERALNAGKYMTKGAANELNRMMEDMYLILGSTGRTFDSDFSDWNFQFFNNDKQQYLTQQLEDSEFNEAAEVPLVIGGEPITPIRSIAGSRTHKISNSMNLETLKATVPHDQIALLRRSKRMWSKKLVFGEHFETTGDEKTQMLNDVLSSDNQIQQAISTVVHEIADGETIQSIAFRYNVDWRSIALYNNLEYPFIMNSNELRAMNLNSRRKVRTIHETILIPVSSEINTNTSIRATVTTKYTQVTESYWDGSAFKERFRKTKDVESKLYGTDFMIDEIDKDFISDNGRDLRKISGISNLIQALRNRLRTPFGWYTDNPYYGTELELLKGEKLDIVSFRMFLIHLKETVLREKRIETFNRVDMTANSGRFNFEFSVKAIGQKNSSKIKMGL